jgi:hypothetical protein
MAPRPGPSGAAAALALLLACTDTSDPGPIVAFDASPAVLRPGATVALHPVFTRGSGRVEPEVGPVESGGSYAVGPSTTARAYTLVVTDGTAEHRRTLELPFAYAHALRPIEPRSLAAGRAIARSARLADGSVLVAGGFGPANVTFAEIEVFDPATGQWTSRASLPSPRTGLALATLADGRVLVTGGSPDGGFPVLAAELHE